MVWTFIISFIVGIISLSIGLSINAGKEFVMIFIGSIIATLLFKIIKILEERY